MQHVSRDRLREVLGPVVSSAGADLEDVEVRTAGRRRVVRVVVDRDGGITLDDVAALSERVSAALDDTDVLGDAPYVLEVTSPGVDRPLTHPRHWRRAVGRLVRCDRHGHPTVTGRVVSADEAGAVLDVDGTSVPVAFADVDRAVVEVEFSRPDAAQPDDAEPHDAPGAG